VTGLRRPRPPRVSAVWRCRWSTRRNRYERQWISAEAPSRTKRRWPGVGPDAVLLAVIASIRHVDTDYDDLLMSGVDRESARAHVHEHVEDVVDAWRDGVVMLDD
jgi:hypothetical protein